MHYTKNILFFVFCPPHTWHFFCIWTFFLFLPFFCSKVKYVDSLVLEGIDVSDGGTRVSVWTNALVKKAIIQDMLDDGSFGRAPVMAFIFIVFFCLSVRV